MNKISSFRDIFKFELYRVFVLSSATEGLSEAFKKAEQKSREAGLAVKPEKGDLKKYLFEKRLKAKVNSFADELPGDVVNKIMWWVGSSAIVVISIVAIYFCRSVFTNGGLLKIRDHQMEVGSFLTMVKVHFLLWFWMAMIMGWYFLKFLSRLPSRFSNPSKIEIARSGQSQSGLWWKHILDCIFSVQVRLCVTIACGLAYLRFCFSQKFQLERQALVKCIRNLWTSGHLNCNSLFRVTSICLMVIVCGAWCIYSSCIWLGAEWTKQKDGTGIPLVVFEEKEDFLRPGETNYFNLIDEKMFWIIGKFADKSLPKKMTRAEHDESKLSPIKTNELTLSQLNSFDWRDYESALTVRTILLPRLVLFFLGILLFNREVKLLRPIISDAEKKLLFTQLMDPSVPSATPKAEEKLVDNIPSDGELSETGESNENPDSLHSSDPSEEDPSVPSATPKAEEKLVDNIPSDGELSETGESNENPDSIHSSDPSEEDPSVPSPTPEPKEDIDEPIPSDGKILEPVEPGLHQNQTKTPRFFVINFQYKPTDSAKAMLEKHCTKKICWFDYSRDEQLKNFTSELNSTEVNALQGSTVLVLVSARNTPDRSFKAACRKIVEICQTMGALNRKLLISQHNALMNAKYNKQRLIDWENFGEASGFSKQDIGKHDLEFQQTKESIGNLKQFLSSTNICDPTAGVIQIANKFEKALDLTLEKVSTPDDLQANSFQKLDSLIKELGDLYVEETKSLGKDIGDWMTNDRSKNFFETGKEGAEKVKEIGTEILEKGKDAGEKAFETPIILGLNRIVSSIPYKKGVLAAGGAAIVSGFYLQILPFMAVIKIGSAAVAAFEITEGGVLTKAGGKYLGYLVSLASSKQDEQPPLDSASTVGLPLAEFLSLSVFHILILELQGCDAKILAEQRQRLWPKIESIIKSDCSQKGEAEYKVKRIKSLLNDAWSNYLNRSV
ncbi:hypothetical protein N9Z70_03615 [Mariniblastus sp.]|nr:hypothetical protein [Mariniblastus sp.]